MYEAVEFVEVWGRVGGTPAVARPVLGLFETQVAAAEAAQVPGRSSGGAAAAISPGG